MSEFDTNSTAFRLAELRSECVRVGVLLGVLGGVLALVLVRGTVSLANGQRGTVWPFVALLGVAIAYEAAWLAYIRRALRLDQTVTAKGWRASLLVECLLPTLALILGGHTAGVGPERALTSPAADVYFLLIILSTLHLDPGLSRIGGVFCAAAYAAASSYVFLVFPLPGAAERSLVYLTSFSYIGLLLLGGFAAGSVANQIRLHVLAALHDALNQAKVAQLQHDLGIARSIQQGLLPKSAPRIEGFDIAGWNQPADETGGDYFDWQQVDDGRLMVTVADVTGHGIGPAICMAACRAYARAIFAAESDLRSAFESLNRHLCEDLPSEKFVTLAAGLLDPQDATLELISAGHGPLLLYLSAEGRFRSYDAQGLPLGLMPKAGYSLPHTLKFGPGDILILITDGFIEWMNPEGQEFGQKRVREIICANCNSSAATIISKLHASVREFAASTPQNDDLTALIIKRVEQQES